MKQPILVLLILSTMLLWRCASDDDAGGEVFHVSGVVSDNSGIPLSGVVVNTIVDTVFTDNSGMYSVAAYPVSAIKFTKVGYGDWIEKLRGRETLNVTLAKLPDNTTTQFNYRTYRQACINGDSLTVNVAEIQDFGEGIGTRTLSRNTVWVLKNKVFVNAGQILTIESGTIIKGGSGQVETACALIVARGGKIMAEGTPDQPILFTSEEDPIVKDAEGNTCTASALNRDDKGLWGGVVVLGKALISTTLPSGELPFDGLPLDEPRAKFGGTDDWDDSGVLRYVSIRHGGTSLQIGKNLHGLSLCGVGGSTEIDHVEVYANAYDGFHFSGGNVNTRYLVSAWCSDDAFDYSDGWRGLNQYWFATQGIDADKGCEGKGNAFEPLTAPVIFNATFRGAGSDTGKRALTFGDNAAGQFHSSIFMQYAFGVDIEFTAETDADSYSRMRSDDLKLQRNIFFELGSEPYFLLNNQSALASSSAPVTLATEFVISSFSIPENANRYEDPNLNGLVPESGGAADAQGSIPEDPFFEFAQYKGCFETGEGKWTEGWTRVEDDL